MTAEIVGGILSGTISTWNDTIIQAANPLTKSFLPYAPILVTVRSSACDANALLLTYLLKSSPTFKKQYAKTGSRAIYDFNFSLLIPSRRLTIATSNSEVDSFVSTNDGSFGYYWLMKKENILSSHAHFCDDPLCASGAVDPMDAASIAACQSAALVINPSKFLYTYDWTASVPLGCYPLVGTVDYSILGTPDNSIYTANSTAMSRNRYARAVLRDRIKFSSWLYSSLVVARPLATNNVYASSEAHRTATLKTICDTECGDLVCGYKYCGYVDCTWARGDFVQTVYECDPDSQTMSVTYSLKPDRPCILNPATSPISGSKIPCSNVMKFYRYGKIASAMSILGMSVTALVMIFVYLHRHEKVIKKSQPIFIYIFIAGAFMMNLSIFAFIGPNTNGSCLLRPWCVNISSTIMFTPLLAKLHRIEVLFRMSKKMKKTKISDSTVRNSYFIFHILFVNYNPFCPASTDLYLNIFIFMSTFFPFILVKHYLSFLIHLSISYHSFFHISFPYDARF